MSRMLSEIEEIPGVVERLLAEGRGEAAAAAAGIERARPSWATIVARGSSDHAAHYARYLLEIELGLPTGLAAASVTTLYGATLRWNGGLAIAFSQSGQSPDVVTVVAEARRGGALTVVITNDPGSPLAEAAEHVITLRAGAEEALPATKTYVAQLAAAAMLVGHLGARGFAPGLLARLPDGLAACLAAARARLEEAGLIEEVAAADRALVASRGYNYATALEVALKLKEAVGLFAEGYSTADLEHGPVALADPAVPVVVIRPDGPVGDAMEVVIARLRATGARPWIVSGGPGGPGRDGVAVGAAGDERRVALPVTVPEALSPLLFVLPGQLLAEAAAHRRGRDPDHLPGLTKVTRTL